MVRLARGVLLGSIVASSACIIPTQLEREAQQGNLPPSIAAEACMPRPFGPIGPYSDNQTVPVLIAVDDPNLDDQLVARFFIQRAGEDTPVFSGQQIDRFDFPQTPDPDHPYRRFGKPTFDLVCERFASANTTSDVYIIVADRPFTDNTAKTQGLTSENHWEVTCVQ